MDWIYDESCWFACPDFTDVFIGCQAFQGFEATRVIIGVHKISEMVLELLVVVVMITLNSCLFDGSIHAFHLAIGPGMLDIGKPVLNAVLIADPVKDVLESEALPLLIGKLNTVVCQHDMNGIGNGCNEIT